MIRVANFTLFRGTISNIPVDSLIINWLFRLDFESSGWHGMRKRQLKRGSELATEGE